MDRQSYKLQNSDLHTQTASSTVNERRTIDWLQLAIFTRQHSLESFGVHFESC